MPDNTRIAAAMILSRMLGDKDLFGIHEAIMKEGALTPLAKGLKSAISIVKRECCSIIILLQKFID